MQKYQIRKTLGVGTFGAVFEAISPTKEIVAIKKMKDKFGDMDEVLALREIKSLRKFDNPNIIKLKQVILANSELFLVFDYVQTNLLQVYTRAQESGRKLTQSEIKKIFFKMTQGLAYLHKKGFFHRDLKPQNVLYHNHDVKLCDLGLARQIRSRPPFTEYVSTRWYRSPELLLRSNSYNSPVDIFALACIILELFMMEPLFPGVNEIDTMNKIVDLLGTPKKQDWPEGYKLASAIRYNFPQSKGTSLLDLVPNASIQIIELLQSMLNYSSRKRPSANDILKHPYFDNFNTKEDNENQKNELKISFYDKPIVELPKNIKIENPKQVELRKTMIKFGDSFTSTFNKNKKQQKVSSEKKQKIEQKTPDKKNKMMERQSHDDINKKFDEMEEILQELQEKQKKKSNFAKSYERTPGMSSKEASQDKQLRLPMFSVDTTGTKSSNNLFKNVRNY